MPSFFAQQVEALCWGFDADIVPQPVAVSTLLEKYRQQHPELVHQQTNGKQRLQMYKAAFDSKSGACTCAVQRLLNMDVLAGTWKGGLVLIT